MFELTIYFSRTFKVKSNGMVVLPIFDFVLVFISFIAFLWFDISFQDISSPLDGTGKISKFNKGLNSQNLGKTKQNKTNKQTKNQIHKHSCCVKKHWDKKFWLKMIQKGFARGVRFLKYSELQGSVLRTKKIYQNLKTLKHYFSVSHWGEVFWEVWNNLNVNYVSLQHSTSRKFENIQKLKAALLLEPVR